MARLEEKVALVSGSARGIGAAIARVMADEGAKVVIGDLLDEEGEALAEEIGPSATYVHLDVTKPADWATAVATAVDKYGKLDVLVNNAGISIPGPIDEYSHADWDKIVAINLTGVFNGIQAGAPALKNAGGGSIVNVSSLAGLIAVPASSGYVATKFGVRGLTKAAALDLGKYGIRVNSIHPGYIRTPMTAAVPPDTSSVALGRGGDLARSPSSSCSSRATSRRSLPAPSSLPMAARARAMPPAGRRARRSGACSAETPSPRCRRLEDASMWKLHRYGRLK